MSMSEQPQEPKIPSSPEALIQMITGFWISQAIYAAAKLGIADLVKEGPKPCEELAQATGMQPQTLYRLLRALAPCTSDSEERGRCQARARSAITAWFALPSSAERAHRPKEGSIHIST